MPRYRFNWSNLDPALLAALSDALGLDGDPAEALRAGYGARPRVDFVRDAWPVLLDEWLPRDDSAAVRIASGLRQRGVGNAGMSDDFEFLASVRNSSGMRQIVLEAFIEHGEQSSDDRRLVRTLSVASTEQPLSAKALPGNPDRAPQQGAPGAVESNEPAQVAGTDADNLPEHMRLMIYLASTLTQHLEAEISLDADGDLAIPSGSATVYVSVIEEPPLVRIFSPLVVNVPVSLDLLTLLNALNAKIPFGRFLHTNGAVLLEHCLMPVELSAQEVVVVVNMIRSAADHFDHQIRQRFGGETALLERAEDEIDV